MEIWKRCFTETVNNVANSVYYNSSAFSHYCVVSPLLSGIELNIFYLQLYSHKRKACDASRDVGKHRQIYSFPVA